MLLPVFVGIYYLGFWLRFEGQLGGDQLQCLPRHGGWIVAGEAGVVRRLAGLSRMASIGHVLRSVGLASQAATGSLVTMAMIQYLLAPSPVIPRSVFLLDWGTTIVVLGGARSLVRGFREITLVAVLLGRSGAGADRRRRRHGRVDAAARSAASADRATKSSASSTTAPSLREPASRACRCSAPANRSANLSQRHRVRQILVMQGELAGSQLRKLIDDAHAAAAKSASCPTTGN